LAPPDFFSRFRRPGEEPEIRPGDVLQVRLHAPQGSEGK
jgi:hypothetical protein